ncbi:hypothetical protein JTB14_022399 [Gonioctena quinquepunctata]|nr:hypothetical protein JTB14_022399 [Gonioctena quinquepunctata]
MNLKEVDLKDVADYMGHYAKIHAEHYRMPNATRDIVRMSKILEKAQGVENTSSRLNQSCNDETIEAEKQDESAVSEINADGLEDTELNSSHGRCKRKRLSWSNEVKLLVETKAKFYFENCETPTISYCSSLINEEKVLKNRTPNSLKAYIMNQIKQQKQFLMSPKLKECKRGERFLAHGGSLVTVSESYRRRLSTVQKVLRMTLVFFSSSAFGQAFLNDKLNYPEEQPFPFRQRPRFPFWLVVDQAFPLSEKIMRPYAGNQLTPKQKVFNYSWVTQREGKSQYCPPNYVDREDNEGNIIPGAWGTDAQGGNNEPLFREIGRVGANNPATYVSRMRDPLATYLSSHAVYAGYQ